MKKLIVAIAILNCAGVPVDRARLGECRTKCGLTAVGNCAQLQELENRAVTYFGKLSYGGPQRVCGAFNGWRIRLHQRRPSDDVCSSSNSWILTHGTCILGYTYDELHEIELPNSDWFKVPLAHELVHVLDLTLEGHAGHCGWKNRGIADAIEKIQGYADNSAPDVDCPAE